MRAGAGEGLRSRVDTTVATVIGIAIVGFVLRVAVLVRPIGVIDRLFIPDDTYYTLSIARSIAHGHGPTVDGHTLTSGFQALLGFLLVPVYWLTDNPDLALRIDLALLVVVDTLTIVLLAWVAYRFAGRVAAVTAAALWALSPVAVSMALGGLETSLAICAAVALVAAWIWANDTGSTRRAVVTGVVAGLAVLARVDIALLILLLGGLQLWRGPRRLLVPGAIAGAVVVAPWWIWCTVQFGTPIPTSGEAAHRLALVEPYSRESLAQVAGAVAGGPFGVWQWLRERLDVHPWVGVAMFWVFVIALVALGVVWARRRVMPQLAVAALPLFAAGLLLFYAWFAVGWYFTRYLAPVACVVSLVIAVAVEHVWATRGTWRVPLFVGATAVLAVGLFAVVARDEPQPHRDRRVAVDGLRDRHRVPRHGEHGARADATRQRVRLVAERRVRLLRRRPGQGGEPRRGREPGGRRRAGTGPDGGVHARPTRRLDRGFHVAHHLVLAEEPAATRAPAGRAGRQGAAAVPAVPRVRGGADHVAGARRGRRRLSVHSMPRAPR